MNREETRRRAEVMLAYAEGKEVEQRSRLNGGGVWTPLSDPTWNWTSFDYRISQKPETVTLYYYRNENGSVSIQTGRTHFGGLAFQPKLIKTETIELEAGE